MNQIVKRPIESIVESILKIESSLANEDLHKILRDITKYAVVYTNLELFNERLLSISPKRLRYYASLHPQANIRTFISNLTKLKTEGYRVDIHTICAADNTVEHLKAVNAAGFEVKSSPDQRKLIKPSKPSCPLDRSLFGPDGLRYPCITKLVGNVPNVERKIHIFVFIIWNFYNHTRL